MPGEQEHHISSVPFFFSYTYKIKTCERTLIAAPSQPIIAPQNLLLHGKLNSGYYRLHFVAASTNPWNSGCGLLGLDFSSGCACVAMNQG